MATGWVKSLQCKSSKMVDDVQNPISKSLLPISSSSSSCILSVQTLKDAIETTTPKPKSSKPRKFPNPNPKPKPESKPKHKSRIPTSSSPRIQKSASVPEPGPTRIRHTRSARTPDPAFPALKELPEGHPSRNVVEIIFHTSWSPKAFPGRVEVVFKVQNPARTVARFEEYRESVKFRAGSATGTICGGGGGGRSDEDARARCAADGNEVMRFHCLGPTLGLGELGGAGWAMPVGKGKGAAVCTFAGSGAAHERGGGGRGRRAMLVCRVVAGRVGKRVGSDVLDSRVGFDSVSGDGGELLVFDSRAVLPCFLVIYKL